MKSFLLQKYTKTALLLVLLLAASIGLFACGGGGGGGGGLPISASSVPTGVVAVAQSSSRIKVSWTAVSGATGYNIYSSNTPSIELTAAGRVNDALITSPSFTDSSALANSTYYYKVTSVGPDGESGGSNVVSATTGSWNVQQAPGMNVTYTFFSTAWSGTEFVAVGGAGSVYTSPTGSTWTSQTAGLDAYNLYRVRWLNGQYVAAGDYTTIYTSPSGTDWTQRLTSADNIPYYGVAWSGSTYLATGLSNTNNLGAQATSATGTSWLASFSTPSVGTLYDVVWSTPTGTAGRFLSVGSGPVNLASPPGLDFRYGSVYTSMDGSNWTWLKVSGYNQFLRGVAWSGQLYVAVGDYAAIFTSPDGLNWTEQAAGTTQNLRSVTWTGKQFIALGGSSTPGENSAILTSQDGVTWTNHDSGTENPLNEIVWSGSNYVIVGNNATILSN